MTEAVEIFRGFVEHGVPASREDETLRDYLERVDVLDRGFTWAELVSPRAHNKQAPERWLRNRTIGGWRNFARVIALANVLRERALLEVPGLRHLTIAAAYRPTGGAANSAHKEAAALDIDAHKGADLKAWYRCAVKLWCELGQPDDDPSRPGTVPFGLGLYTWAGKVGPFAVRSGYRVHIDVGARAGTRSWQGVGRKFLRPHRLEDRSGRSSYYGLPVLLAVEQGLDVPSLRDL